MGSENGGRNEKGSDRARQRWAKKVGKRRNWSLSEKTARRRREDERRRSRSRSVVWQRGAGCRRHLRPRSEGDVGGTISRTVA